MSHSIHAHDRKPVVTVTDHDTRYSHPSRLTGYRHLGPIHTCHVCPKETP